LEEKEHRFPLLEKRIIFKLILFASCCNEHYNEREAIFSQDYKSGAE